MNAYELADEFDWMTEEKIVQWCNDVVNMLRQQADRIVELSKNVDELEEELLKTPQIKELSDEEIETMFFEILGIEPAPSSVFDFARAILKKASE
jgi:hypothetical protein